MLHRLAPLTLLLTTGCVAAELDGGELAEVRVELRGETPETLILVGPADASEALVEHLLAGVRTDELIEGAGSIAIDSADGRLVAPVVEGVDADVIASVAAADGYEIGAQVRTQALVVATILTSRRFAQCGDYAGDGRCDATIFRPSTGEWWIRGLAFPTMKWGQAGDVPLFGDYDADGKTDRTVYRPSTGQWRIYGSSQGAIYTTFGAAGDTPLPGDYDGDGKTDVAVVKPTTPRELWVIRSRDGLQSRFQLWPGKLVSADVNADGKSDVASFQAATFTWAWTMTDGGSATRYWGGLPAGTIASALIPYAAPEPTGQHLHLFSPSNMQTSARLPGTGGTTGYFAYQQGDLPVVVDDGNNDVADLAAWNPSTGVWHGRDFSGTRTWSFFWGGPGDIAVRAN